MCIRDSLVADAIAAVTGAAGIIVTLLTLAHVASVVTALADLIDAANLPAANGMAYGVALQFMNGTLLAMNRGTGAVYAMDLPWWIRVPGFLQPGIFHSFSSTPGMDTYYFWNDRKAIPWVPSTCVPGRNVCHQDGEPIQ